MDCGKLAEFAETSIPATREELDYVRSAFSCDLPQDYIGLMKCSNGLVFKHTQSLIIYSTSEIQARNTTFEVSEYAPSWILIGDDGGGNGIFLDCSRAKRGLYLNGLGVVDPPTGTFLAHNVSEWVEHGFDLGN